MLMKKLLSIALISLLALPVAAFAQGTLKIGTVDMQRAFKEYNKTKDAEAKVNDAKNAAKKSTTSERTPTKKAPDEFNNLNKQLDAPALSADAKTQRRRSATTRSPTSKPWSARSTSSARRASVSSRSKALRMREGIVKEITDVVMDKVKANTLDVVFDKSGNQPQRRSGSFNVFSRQCRFTNDVIAVLNKPGRVTAPLATGSATATPTPRKP